MLTGRLPRPPSDRDVLSLPEIDRARSTSAPPESPPRRPSIKSLNGSFNPNIIRPSTPPINLKYQSVKVTIDQDELDLWENDAKDNSFDIWNSVQTFPTSKKTTAWENDNNNNNNHSTSSRQRHPTKQTTHANSPRLHSKQHHQQDPAEPRPWSKGREILREALTKKNDFYQSGIIKQHPNHIQLNTNTESNLIEDATVETEASSSTATSPKWRPSGYTNTAKQTINLSASSPSLITKRRTNRNNNNTKYSNNTDNGIYSNRKKKKSTVVHTVRRSLYQRAMLRDNGLEIRAKRKEKESKHIEESKRKTSISLVQMDIPSNLAVTDTTKSSTAMERKINRNNSTDTTTNINNTSNNNNTNITNTSNNSNNYSTTSATASTTTIGYNPVYTSQPPRSVSVRVVSAGAFLYPSSNKIKVVN